MQEVQCLPFYFVYVHACVDVNCRYQFDENNPKTTTHLLLE